MEEAKHVTASDVLRCRKEIMENDEAKNFINALARAKVAYGDSLYFDTNTHSWKIDPLHPDFPENVWNDVVKKAIKLTEGK